MSLTYNLKNIIDSLNLLDDQTNNLLVKQGLYKTYIKNLIMEEFNETGDSSLYSEMNSYDKDIPFGSVKLPNYIANLLT